MVDRTVSLPSNQAVIEFRLESCHDDNDGDDDNYHDHDHDNGHDNKILIYYKSSQKNAVVFEFLKLCFVKKIFQDWSPQKNNSCFCFLILLERVVFARCCLSWSYEKAQLESRIVNPFISKLKIQPTNNLNAEDFKFQGVSDFKTDFADLIFWENNENGKLWFWIQTLGDRCEQIRVSNFSFCIVMGKLIQSKFY